MKPQDPPLLRRLLRDTDLDITDIAFATDRESLGTFGSPIHGAGFRDPAGNGWKMIQSATD